MRRHSLLAALLIATTTATTTTPATLLSYTLNTTVSRRLAQTTLTAVFDNPSACAITVPFTLQLPRGARLSGATLSDGHGCTTDGVVSSTASASAGFDAAVAHGQQAALIEAHDITSLKVQLSLPAQQTLTVTMRYESLLQLARGVLNVSLPLVPSLPVHGVLEARLAIESDRGAGPISSLACSADGAPTSVHVTGSAARLTVDPAVARTASGLAINAHCAFAPGALPTDGLLLADGDMDGSAYYLLYLFNPSAGEGSESLPRAIHFVLDVSGSMGGPIYDVSDVKKCRGTRTETFRDRDRWFSLSHGSPKRTIHFVIRCTSPHTD